MTLHKKYILPAILLLLFGFRLGFGLCSEFWFEDEMQIYLIGLKFFSTGAFPFFGPDIVYTGSQIPGALQGLLVGLPFYVLPIPEAPYLLLNLLTFSALCLFAYWLNRRFTGIPWWFTWIWVLTCPWVMNLGTHVLNPSYVLPAAIIFFISFFEAVPVLSSGMLSKTKAYLLMGFSMIWIAQFHMSWVLLLPFALTALIVGMRDGWKRTLIYCALMAGGFLLAGVTLIPTFMKYGLNGGSGGSMHNIVFNPDNLKQGFTLLSRLLSFGSFEASRFLGSNTAARFAFIRDYWWASPFIIFAGIIGFAQALWLGISFFLKNPSPHFKQVKILLIAAFVLTWASFVFSVKGPSSHTFYLMFPLVMIYSFYCWQNLFVRKWFRILMVLLLVSGIVFHTTVGMENYKKRSMYVNRSIPVKAITEKNYKILGERRSWDRNN
ncbi:MAG: hypothetical protein WCM76_07125 [Bacteroidota bacterium]